MKVDGRRTSDNVEDRRGMSTGKMVVGGGIGTVVIALIVLFLGGDPTQVLNTAQETGQTSGEVVASPEEEEMAHFVSVVLAGTEDVWGEIFAQSNKTYRQPKLVLFRDQVQSACGYASGASGPFYCPGDEAVYIDLSFFDALRSEYGANGDFAIAYVVAHEVGHHVQNLLGILEQVNYERARMSQVQSNQLLVRLELQADFLAGMWAHYDQQMFNSLETGDVEEAMTAAASVGDDVLQKRYQGRVIPDAFTHGSAAQRKEWFRKGYTTGDFEQGDTFSANL
ncbi:MAG: neutral zinc metallopeptidase [Bacteroidales bacterium]|jgi:predicted metalloprotease|nr:neutral zinc metallopeptidase [Bacteroidales bacterium]